MTLEEIMDQLHELHGALAKLTQQARHDSKDAINDPAYLGLSMAMSGVYQATDGIRIHQQVTRTAVRAATHAQQDDIDADLDGYERHITARRITARRIGE